jgi:hypothetical protein
MGSSKTIAGASQGGTRCPQRVGKKSGFVAVVRAFGSYLIESSSEKPIHLL